MKNIVKMLWAMSIIVTNFIFMFFKACVIIYFSEKEQSNTYAAVRPKDLLTSATDKQVDYAYCSVTQSLGRKCSGLLNLFRR